jgi:hypothetical protein
MFEYSCRNGKWVHGTYKGIREYGKPECFLFIK